MTGTANGNGAKIGTVTVKQGLAQMLKGGVIVSVKRDIENMLKQWAGWVLFNLRTKKITHQDDM